MGQNPKWSTIPSFKILSDYRWKIVPFWRFAIWLYGCVALYFIEPASLNKSKAAFLCVTLLFNCVTSTFELCGLYFWAVWPLLLSCVTSTFELVTSTFELVTSTFELCDLYFWACDLYFWACDLYFWAVWPLLLSLWPLLLSCVTCTFGLCDLFL